jgi:hypothetical protein
VVLPADEDGVFWRNTIFQELAELRARDGTIRRDSVCLCSGRKGLMGVNVGVCPVDNALLGAVTLLDDDVVAVEWAVHFLEGDMKWVSFLGGLRYLSRSVGSSFFSILFCGGLFPECEFTEEMIFPVLAMNVCAVVFFPCRRKRLGRS